MPSTKRLVPSVLASAALAIVLAVAPFGFGPADGEALSMTDGVVHLERACAQASDCEPAEDYICSKEGGDRMDHKCSAGCGEEEIQ